jgi:hypothetical protein
MPATTSEAPAVAPPLRSPWLVAILGWLVPGAGHLLLGRRYRGMLIFATVLVCFSIGLLLRGPLFEVTGAGDVLSRLIQWGGHIGDMAAGLPYFVAVAMGYGPPDRAGHNADYGSKFIVAAGLLNVLSIVDAYEIATSQKA